MKTECGFVIESLEMRSLFSAGAGVPPMVMFDTSLAPRTAAPAAVHTVALKSSATLHGTVGAPCPGTLGFYVSLVIDPPLGLSASINWGDGTVSAGTLRCGVHGKKGGYQISGSHTYSTAGTFKIKTTVTSGPITQAGGPAAELPTRVVAMIAGKAIIAAAPSISSGGVTVDEIAGTNFTANVGFFTIIAPGLRLRAHISWGDGGASAGALNAAGVIGIDVLKFDVSGLHTYAQPGIYPVHVMITRGGTGPTAAAERVAGTIDSAAEVTSPEPGFSLSGTISGTYTTPQTNPDVGKTFDLVGAGSAGQLGSISGAGNVSIPGFIASSAATGSLTLTNPQGSVTLLLTGPAESGFGPFPDTLAYSITQATGAYAGEAGTGSIAVTLRPTASAAAVNRFTFVIS